MERNSTEQHPKRNRHKPSDSSVSSNCYPLQEFWIVPDQVERIVEKLSDDPEALKLTSTLSRTFRSASRLYQCSSLDLCLSPSQERREQFLKNILSADTQLFDHVRKLRLWSALRYPGSVCLIPVKFVNFLLKGLISAARSNPLAGVCALDISDIDSHWDCLGHETRSLIIDLIESSQQLHSIRLSACHSCSNLLFLIAISANTGRLKHLQLYGSKSYFLCNHSNPENEFPDRVKFLTAPPIQTLRIGSVTNEKLEEYLFNPQCLLDFSCLEELYLDRVEYVGLSPAIFKLSRLASRTMTSLIWKVGIWCPDLTWEGSQLGAATLTRPVRIVTIRRLSLWFLSSEFGFGMDRAFDVLYKKLGFQMSELEELNLVYPAEIGYASLLSSVLYHPESQQEPDASAHKRILHFTLSRADFEFGLLRVLYGLVNLGTIRLLIQHGGDGSLSKLFSPWLPSDQFQSSERWPIVKGSAPEMHKTGKLFLRTGSYSQAINFFESVSLRNKA